MRAERRVAATVPVRPVTGESVRMRRSTANHLGDRFDGLDPADREFASRLVDRMLAEAASLFRRGVDGDCSHIQLSGAHHT